MVWWGGRPTSPYRLMPRDFPEVFARVGWDGIEAEMSAHKNTIEAWIIQYDTLADAEGRPLLCEVRRAWLERDYAENRGGRRIPGRRPRAKAYIQGKRLPAVIPDPKQE